MKATLKNYLKTQTLGQLASNLSEPVYCTVTCTTEEALNMMAVNQITHMPVLNAGQCIGVVNLVNVVCHPNLGAYFEGKKSGDSYDEDKSLMNTAVVDLLDMGLSYESKGVHSYEATDYVINTISPLCDVHQIVVLGKGYVRMLSQSNVINFLHVGFESINLDLSATLGKIPISQIVSSEREVVSITTSDTALHGFKIMAETMSIRALPVLDDKGKCVATLSLSNLRGMNASALGSVLMPVVDFLSVSNTSIRVVQLKMNDTLADVVRELVLNKIHRIWLVNDDEQVVNVVSMTDVLMYIDHVLRSPATE